MHKSLPAPIGTWKVVCYRQPDTIGRSAGHGRIRLANWDAARVVNQVTVGMTVEIY